MSVGRNRPLPISLRLGSVPSFTLYWIVRSVTPNNPAKKATNSNYAVAALDPRQNNGVGNPANVTQLAIGPGIAGGGPLGSDGAASPRQAICPSGRTSTSCRS